MPTLRGFRQEYYWQLSRILTHMNEDKPKEKSNS